MFPCRLLLTCLLLALALVADTAQAQPAARDQHGDPLPDGAVARLGTLRWRHDDLCLFAAYLPDGKQVVSASADQTVRVWGPSGKEIRRINLTAPEGSVPRFGRAALRCAALARDGKTIATWCGGEEIQLHDVATGKQLPRLTWKANEKGKQIAFGFGAALAFSPNGVHLASQTNDATLRIWDWAKAREVRNFDVFGGWNVVFAPDGKSIATVGFHKQGGHAVKLWDPATGLELRSTGPIPVLGGGNDVVFSPDGQTLAVPTRAAVILVDAATGKEIGKLTNEKMLQERRMWPAAVVFGKDGTRLNAVFSEGGASGPGGLRPRPGLGGVVSEWDVGTRKLLRQYTEAMHATHISLSPDGNRLVLTSFGPRGPQLLDLAAGQEIAALTGPAEPVRLLRFTADGKYLLTQLGRAGSGAYGRKWDAGNGKDLGPINFPFPAVGVAASPDGKILVSLQLTKWDAPDSACKVIMVDAADGKELGRIDLGQRSLASEPTLYFGPKSNILAVPRMNAIELYEAPSGKLLRTLDNPGGGGPIIFSPDGKFLAYVVNFNTLGLWDVTTGQQVGSLPLTDSRRFALSGGGMFSPDGRCFALRMPDGTTVLYELASALPRRRIGLAVKAKQFQRLSLSSAFSADGKSLVMGGGDGIVRVWDVATGKELATLKGHTAGVNAVAYAPDGKTLASGSDDGTALVWDASKIARPAAAARALNPGGLEKNWQALAETDAARAWAAMGDLVAAPEESVAWIKDRVKPAAPLDMKRVQELIARLDDGQFKVREQAAADLLSVGEQILPVLDKALAVKPPLGMKKRLEALRSKMPGMVLQAERLRAHRAVEVLEIIGTRLARQVLQALADGAPAALLTTSAQSALKR